MIFNQTALAIDVQGSDVVVFTIRKFRISGPIDTSLLDQLIPKGLPPLTLLKPADFSFKGRNWMARRKRRGSRGGGGVGLGFRVSGLGFRV